MNIGPTILRNQIEEIPVQGQLRQRNAAAVFFIGIIASKTRFASPPPAASASVSARGVICQERPQRSFAPTALVFLTAIADDRVPIAVRLFLIVRRDLERKGLGVPELRATVETEARNAQNCELHCQDIALRRT